MAAVPLEQQPLILIDIDGVINAVGRKTRYWKDAKNIDQLDAVYPDGTKKSFQVLYSPTVVKAINTWSEIAEVRWLSAWDDRANTYFAPAVGLEQFELARSSPETFKLDCFLQWHEENPDRVIIWIDDQISNFKCDNEHNPKYADAIFKRKNTILISPIRGLIGEHIVLIDKLLKDKKECIGKKIHKFSEGGHTEAGCVIC